MFGPTTKSNSVTRAALETALEALRETLRSRERELDAVRSEYDTLLEECGAGVLVLDREGVIVRANATAREVLGARPYHLTGKTLLQATLSTELSELFRAAADGGTLARREVRLGTGDKTVSAVVTPVQTHTQTEDDAGGRYLVIAQDVTELRRLEVVRRDFVANVSHELRTPLASIRAMAETLSGGALDDAEVAPRFLQTIVTETERLTRIAEDLLVLSDAESHAAEKQPVSLTDRIAELVARFHAQAERAGIKLTAAVPAGLVVHANADQMEQVIVNLVDNAIKYTPAGGQVHVSGEAHGEGVVIRVTDTGIGILRQDLSRIFERFYRVDKARSRQSGGTGLGLSIVKHIVEAHGGFVAVESEFNRGSMFSIFLPAHAPVARWDTLSTSREATPPVAHES